jgi:hypothetical protein
VLYGERWQIEIRRGSVVSGATLSGFWERGTSACGDESTGC